MANNYYNHGTYPTPNSPGSSALLRNELDLITAGFDKLPSLVLGNANKLVVINSAGTALTVAGALANLDVVDTGFLIQDNGDSTKKARFEVSGITTGTTRAFTLPDANTTLVGTDATQTLTNKTLTSPAISGGTINNAVIGGVTPAAGTFTSLAASSITVSGSAVTTAANTQTLTNKTLTSPTINNGVLVGGTMDGTTIGGGSPAAGTFTTLAATSATVGGANVVTVSASQTLTNKTLTSHAISGGTVDSATIGGTTPGAGTFTSLASSTLTVGGVAATTASNTQTLTNKTISGASNTLSNIDNVSLVNSSVTIGSTSVSLGGTVTTIAGLSLTSPVISSISNSGTVTIPATTDTLVGRATTDTLTNKTLSGSSNTFSNIPNTAITGLGTMSTQAASNVSISGGSITGITDLAVADGGTGASTAAGARTNLLPSYTSNAGKVLAVNALGTDVEWSSVATGTVTSVAVSGGTTGLTTSGGPITSSGTITLAGTLAIANGGTGATTVGDARVNLLPAYTGNASKVLALNSGGTDLEWVSIGGTGTVTSITAGTGLTGGTITATGTIAIDTAVVATLSGSQTLTNKTLTAPVISTISNTGTLTLPTSTDTLVGRATTDTLTNKTISGASNTLSNIGNSSLTNSSVTIGSTSVSLGATAASLAGLTSVGLANAGTGAFGLTVSHNGTMTANRTLTLNVNDAARTVSLAGNLTLAAAFTTSGANALTLTTTGSTNVTLPTTGTLATLAGSETFTNKTLTSPTISGGTINNAVIGGSTPAAGTFTTLTANGNVVLGDNTADTLQIYANAVTWSGTPTHSSNHTFSGDVVVAGQVSLGGAAGAEGLRVVNTASAVNYLQVAGATTGNRLSLTATGTDTDIGVDYFSKGGGFHIFRSAANGVQFLVGNTASSVNYVVASGGATGAGVTVSAAGSDTNINLILSPKGTGNVGVGTTAALQRLTVANTSITGGGPAASGSAADPNAVARFVSGSVALDFGAYATGANWLQVRSAGNYATNYDLALLPNGGNVGVGAAPGGSYKLEVTGKTYSSGGFVPRVSTTTSSATPTINTDNVDMYGLTAQAADITSFSTNLSGTPVNGQKLWIYIVGTATRAITWGASFEASTVALPTTTVGTNRLDVGFVWNAATSKWRCVATA